VFTFEDDEDWRQLVTITVTAPTQIPYCIPWRRNEVDSMAPQIKAPEEEDLTGDQCLMGHRIRQTVHHVHSIVRLEGIREVIRAVAVERNCQDMSLPVTSLL
jgi:hypothetical protein